MVKERVKIGVIGVGHLGQHHAKHYKNLSSAELIGIFDEDKMAGKLISEKYKVKLFDSVKSLIDEVEAVSVVTPTKSHYKISKLCIQNNVHVFIEKPITATLKQADSLLKLSEESNTIIQVGHIERLNPALIALKSYNINPKLIEIQRLAPYTARGTDVPVVLDKMIHDIDIILSLVNSKVETIDASGLSILTDSLDIAHARISFQSGTVASIMSSRIAKDDVRKIKLFQKDLYATIDLLMESTEIYKVTNDKNNQEREGGLSIPFQYKSKNKYITYDKPNVPKYDSLKEELNNFILSIRGIEKPIVSGQDAKDALEVATIIEKKIIRDIK